MAFELPKIPVLPSLNLTPRPALAEIGSGGIGTGGGGTFETGVPTYGTGGSPVPVTFRPTSSGSGSTATASTASTGSSGSCGSFWSLFTSPLQCGILRLLFFILGLIAIAGAIYLYKDTRFLITAPVNGVKKAVKAGTEAAGAASAVA